MAFGGILTSSALGVELHNLVNDALVGESGPLGGLNLIRVATFKIFNITKLLIVFKKANGPDARTISDRSGLPLSGLSRLISIGICFCGVLGLNYRFE